MNSAVGLVHRQVDCGGVPLLERLVVGLVPECHGSAQQPTENKGLQQEDGVIRLMCNLIFEGLCHFST